MNHLNISAVQHERGPRKPKLRQPDTASGTSSTASLGHMHQRQLTLNRARHQHYSRQPYVNTGSPLNTSRPSLTGGAGFNVPPANSIRQQSITSLNQCNNAAGQSILSRDPRNAVFVNGRGSLMNSNIHYPILGLSSSGSNLPAHQEPYCSQKQIDCQLISQYDQANLNDIQLSSTSAQRQANSQPIPNQSFSSSDSDDDGSEEIIVDVDQEGGSCNQRNSTDARLQTMINRRQLNLPNKQRTTTSKRAHDPSHQTQPVDAQFNRDSNLINRHGCHQQQTRNYCQGSTCNSPLTCHNLNPRRVTTCQQQVTLASYPPQLDCDLMRSPARSVSTVDLPSSHLPTSNATNQTLARTEDMLAMSLEEGNFANLSNFLSSSSQMDTNLPSSSSLSDDHAASATVVHQAFKNQQLRNFIFASFLSRLGCSIESQALLTLLLKNNNLPNQKSQAQQQQIKQTATNNNNLQQSFDASKVSLAQNALLGPATMNNGAIRSLASSSDVGSIPSISVTNMEQQRLGNFGNSPTINSSCPSAKQDNDNQTILNSGASSSSLVSASTTMNSDSGSDIKAINVNIPNQQITNCKRIVTTSWQRINSTGLPSDISPFVTSSNAGTNSVSPTASRSKHETAPTTCPGSSSLTSIDFKNIKSLITPNDPNTCPINASELCTIASSTPGLDAKWLT